MIYILIIALLCNSPTFEEQVHNKSPSYSVMIQANNSIAEFIEFQYTITETKEIIVEHLDEHHLHLSGTRISNEIYNVGIHFKCIILLDFYKADSSESAFILSGKSIPPIKAESNN